MPAHLANGRCPRSLPEEIRAEVGAIVTTAFVMGLCIASRRTLRAWRGSGWAPSLFHQPDLGYDALLELTIRALRERLALPPDGLAEHRRGLNGLAPRR